MVTIITPTAPFWLAAASLSAAAPWQAAACQTLKGYSTASSLVTCRPYHYIIPSTPVKPKQGGDVNTSKSDFETRQLRRAPLTGYKPKSSSAPYFLSEPLGLFYYLDRLEERGSLELSERGEIRANIDPMVYGIGKYDQTSEQAFTY